MNEKIMPSVEQLRKEILEKLNGNRATANYLGMCLAERYGFSENEMSQTLVGVFSGLEAEGLVNRTPDWKQFCDGQWGASEEIKQRYIPYVMV